MKARLVALGLSCVAVPAAARDSGLLYFSAAPDYLGAGWMQAPRGLDFSGPVFAAELGGSPEGTPRAALTAGWRLVEGRLVATLSAGVEVAEATRPLAVGDFWWDKGRGMAAAHAKLTPDYMDWRVAVGARPVAGSPWFGPEISMRDGTTRLGLHATGLDFIAGSQARFSAGYFDGGVYGELSLWRRF